MSILKRWWLGAAFGLTAACASNPYAGVSLEPGAADPELQDEIRRAMAGDKYAQLSLGVRYETGDGVSVDYKKARQFYHQAAGDSSGVIWIYMPPTNKNDRGRVHPVSYGKKEQGLIEAKSKLKNLKFRDK